MTKTPEELKAYKEKRNRKSLEYYYRMKSDPVAWEKYVQKRQKREKKRYDRIKQQLEEIEK